MAFVRPIGIVYEIKDRNRNNSQSFLLWKQFKTKKDKTLIGKEKEWRMVIVYLVQVEVRSW